MASLNHHDLQFILKQIEISEAHAAGANLRDLIDHPLLPYGVRTVDGTWNNLIEGRENYGAADQPFPSVLDPDYINDNDNDTFDPDGPGPAPADSNNDYAQPGNVVDADPRIISNLIASQSSSNAAALIAALTHAGSTNLVADADTARSAEAAAESAAAAAATAAQSATTAAATLATANAQLAAAEALAEAATSPEVAEAAAEAVAAATLEVEAATTAHDAAVAASEAAAAAAASAATAFEQVQEDLGITFENNTWVVPNVAPDEGLSAPFNSWMTLFGQFFDHGLDMVAKGGNGTVYVPLQPDDPLYVPGGHTNFMVLTRTSASPGADGVFGTADDVRAPNLTTPFVDQNQTYTSHASHQVFLREYTLNAEGKPVATGNLLDGQNGGLPTWADIKAQALMLGIKLTDADVGNIPLLATDPYGNFIPGPNGYAQVVFPGTPPVLVEGTAEGLSTTGAVRTNHAFLDDIAHNAVPVMTAGGELLADADTLTGNAQPVNNRGQNTSYDNELLDRHFITGDGRGNENIGLTTVHHIFHSEHNRQIEEIKATILESNDPAFIAEWQHPDGSWDGERLFQAARFATEMQYQHLVFEEFGRKIQPDVDLFVFNPMTDINPAIVTEFADVVYRFGHSMLRETVDMIDGAGNQTEVGLIQAFLNPVMFDSLGQADTAAAAIVRGMTRQVGNEIDEFVTEALRNNLLGLPLDLATINIARARENGVPSLNKAREQFFEMTGDTQLKPYESWTDFAYNIKNPASIINFVAAYGTHASITGATTTAAKQAAAEKLVIGGTGAPADRVDFLNGTGAWATAETGLNNIDLWIGGLAEKKMAFGGMLGSTFSFVFEFTMENLQNGDRFYYLSRTQGLNFLNELEANSFAKLIMLNSDLGNPGQAHLPGDIFSVPNHILEMNEALQIGDDPVGDDPYLEALSPLVVRKDLDNDGDWDHLAYMGYDHVVLGGTDEDDVLLAGGGDDTIWGDGGNDYIEAGYGVDRAHGGTGDDIIVNAGTDIGETDFLHGEEGNDVIHGGSGLALIFGEEGNDFISTGKDGKEAFGGEGNDFILGDEGADFLLGNEGDDWIEAGNGFDTTAGDNSELFFNSTVIGHDVMFAGQNEHDFDAESGDDIMVQGESVMRNEGMLGFDWAIHKGMSFGANSDLTIRIFETDAQDILRNRFDQVEALSGWHHNDVLRGDNRVLDPAEAELDMTGHGLDAAGIARIDGLDDILGGASSFNGGNILLGGRGSDVIEGRGGNDVIDGDAWLNVRISVRDRNNPDQEIRSVDSLTEIQSDMFNRNIVTDQLQIVREILTDAPDNAAIDTAVFSDVFASYDITQNEDGSYTVAHVRGTLTDGVDTVRNVERMQFADGAVDYNREATGRPAVTFGRLTEGQALTASMGTLADRDGIPAGSVTYQWQASSNGFFYSVIEGATEATFTPTQDQVGQMLRVVAVYTDGRGFEEQIASEWTPFLGDLVMGTEVNNTRGGTAYDDEIHGLGGADNLLGGSGSDLVYGGTGNDRLNGGAGNDVLDGGAGADVMIGESGDDTYHVDNAADVVTESLTAVAGGGVDTVLSAVSYVLGNNVDNLVLGEGNINGTGNALVNLIVAGSGNNVIDGGAGWDTLSFENATGSGTDGVTLNLSVRNGDGYSTASGISGSDLVRNIEHLTGSAYNDSLTANNRENVLSGGAGADYLNGREGADTLSGGIGDDTLVGGTGDDHMTGGEGADLFVLAGLFGDDVVADFDANAAGGQDKMDLTALGITAATFGSVVTVTDEGADALVQIGDSSIRLLGIDDINTISSSDFLLAP